jgi:hypothetical protein
MLVIQLIEIDSESSAEELKTCRNLKGRFMILKSVFARSLCEDLSKLLFDSKLVTLSLQ